MSDQLLTIKFYPPPLRPGLVERQRLLDKLNQGLTGGHRLSLVSAPAGYGKTTLASSWLQESTIPSAWLSLDEGDNDPLRFMQNLIAALQTIVPFQSTDLSSALQGMQPEAYQPLLDMLINAVSERAVSFGLVLDDFHLIQSQPVLDMLTFLLEHIPSCMHLMILTRSDPPFPLARMRARDQLVEIRADQLRFTTAEVSAFLNDIMDLRLSHDEVDALERRTEGWVAGLHLAALSMQGRQDTSSFVAAFTGSHIYIMDYLTDEVLQIQTEQVRSFLLKTSILNRLCSSLCEAVWDARKEESCSGQVMLEILEQMNLFLIPLDDQRRWYRYHHLFADMLNRRLERTFPNQIPELHRRASFWYEQNGLLLDAIQHSLLAGDQKRAAQLVSDHGCTLLMRGEGFTLLKLVEAVGSFAQTHPWLAALRAWALELTGHLEEVESALQRAESLVPSTIELTFEARIMLGTIASIRAHHANNQGEAIQAAEYAQKALEYLPAENDFACSLRSVAISILGDATWTNGDLDAARQAYLEARQMSKAANNLYMELIVNSNLAEVLLEQGELRQAARIFSEGLGLAAPPDGQKLPLAKGIYAGLAKIAYEWNRLDEATSHIHQCIQLSQQWGDFPLLAKSYIMLARIEQARGEGEGAAEALRTGEQIFYSHPYSSRQSAWMNSAIGSWWITQGNTEKAAYLAHQSSVSLEATSSQAGLPALHDPEVLFLLRLLLAQGEFETVLVHTERLLPKAETGKQTRRLIELQILQALAWQGKKDTKQALSVLEKALDLAQREGFIRIFLDQGEPLIKLLYQSKAHQMGTGFASELLAAWGKPAGEKHAPAHQLIEPLTLREIEVLNLINAGASNQDIADQLVISLPTVKRHISNIYTKLGAKSRTQAVSLGRDLGLIS